MPTGTFGRPAPKGWIVSGRKWGRRSRQRSLTRLRSTSALIDMIGTGEEKLLSVRLHKAVDMKKDKLWQLLAAEFQS